MGNHPSGDGLGGVRPTALGRRAGALGLSKNELDRRCKPSGLYPGCSWDDKAIRRLIGDGKLAARLTGDENRTTQTHRECPICFLQYSQINVTKCCQANICTECYLQVRPQKERNNTCPFCNDPKLSVTVAKTMEAEEIQMREEEEQRAIEATIKARACPRDTESLGSADGSADIAVGVPASPGGFGSSLEQNATVRRMRARSESMSSDNDAAFSGFKDEQLLKQLSLTSEDRHALESEMKAQLTHPLNRQIEAEAEERRVANVREYYRTNSGRLREARAAEILRGRASSRRGRFSRLSNNDLGRDSSSRRDWNQIVDAFERGGNGEVQTLDDLVVLEAALILSMEHESRRQPSAADQTSASGGTGSSEFDAAQHAREGFPLVQDLLSRRSETNESDSSARSFLGSSARRLGRRSQLLRGASGRAMAGGQSDSSPGMLLRDITEDEQMALAIAMSLRESERAQGQGADDEEETEGSAVAGGQLSIPLAEVSEEVHEDANDDDQESSSEQETQEADDENDESTNDMEEQEPTSQSQRDMPETVGADSVALASQISDTLTEEPQQGNEEEAGEQSAASTSTTEEVDNNQETASA